MHSSKVPIERVYDDHQSCLCVATSFCNIAREIVHNNFINRFTAVHQQHNGAATTQLYTSIILYIRQIGHIYWT